ncbi:hypothetical protein AUP68_10463 [Ilyonectria robusta]
MQEEVAKVGVVALCWSSVDQHLAGEHDARCPGSTAGGQAFGVQCPCQTPNLTYDVWLHSVRAPSIFYVAQKTDFIRVMTVLHQLFAKLPPPDIEDFMPLISAAGLNHEGSFLDAIITNQPRLLLKEDFLARVGVVGDAQSMIPDSLNLSSLRTRMQVYPLSHTSEFPGPDTSHGQERFILVLVGPITQGILNDAFSALASVWIPGQSQQRTLTVNGKLHAMTLGYFSPFPHSHDADVLKRLIADLHQPQHFGRGTIMFGELDEWVKSIFFLEAPNLRLVTTLSAHPQAQNRMSTSSDGTSKVPQDAHYHDKPSFGAFVLVAHSLSTPVEVCKFFRHDIADKETGVRLPGLTKPSRNY